MTPLAKRMLDVAIEEIRGALEELQQNQIDRADFTPQWRPPTRTAPAIATKVPKALKAAPAAADVDRRIVLVCIDGRPPRLALVTDENPKPGFKTIRLADGRSTKKFARKEHRVLDSEIRRDATADERANGIGRHLKAVSGGGK